MTYEAKLTNLETVHIGVVSVDHGQGDDFTDRRITKVEIKFIADEE